MSEPERYLQNDPGRAGGLITDGHGEFVQEAPGGAFDPRTFRASPGEAPDPDPGDAGAPEPPMDGERMVGPGEEIDKAQR